MSQPQQSPLPHLPPLPSFQQETPEGIIGVRSEYYEIPRECIPDVSKLVVDDGVPLDSQFAEKQQRLLTTTLHVSWRAHGCTRPFMALANVGLYFQHKKDPLVPDVMLALDKVPGLDLRIKENRSYFTWEVGKPPNLVIELVSDPRGKEDTRKLVEYAAIGVGYYVIYDPALRLGGEALEAYALHGCIYEPIDPAWLPDIQLGLKLWEGVYQGGLARYVRWCDEKGQLLPNEEELAESQRQALAQVNQQAEQERRDKEVALQQAEKERHDKELALQQAEQERRDKELALQQAEQERLAKERLAARLRELGIDPKA